MPLGRPVAQMEGINFQEWLQTIVEVSEIGQQPVRVRDMASSNSPYPRYDLPQDDVMLLSDDGALYSWGYGSYATCSGMVSSHTFPIEPTPKAWTITPHASFALSQEGNIHAWGNNANGVLGIGSEQNGSVSVTSHATIPGIQIESLDQLVLSEDQKRAYAITHGTLYAWGNNANGVLGVGDNAADTVWTPQAVEIPEESGAVMRVVANNNGQTFALTQEGVLYAWGNNTANTLGLGEGQAAFVTTPAQIATNVKQVHLSEGSVYMVMNDGSVKRWGTIRTGAFSGTETVLEPTAVEGLSDIREIFSLHGYLYAVTGSGNLFAWGKNMIESV